jgi:hypothetical protein
MRFHIDSTKYRRWNMDPAVAAECPPLIHPEDLASVGQLLPVQPAPGASAGGAAPAATVVAPAQPAATSAHSPERGQKH